MCEKNQDHTQPPDTWRIAEQARQTQKDQVESTATYAAAIALLGSSE